MQLERAAGRRTMENKCKSNQTRSWGQQLAAVRLKTIANLIKSAIGEGSWPPYDGNNYESNQTCSWGDQLVAVRWKTIVNLITRAVGEGSCPPYDGKQL